MTGVRTLHLDGVPVDRSVLEPLGQILRDPRVARTLGGVPEPGQLEELIDRQAAHWAAHGFGYWAWTDRRTGALVARGGLSHVIVGGRAEVEVGWTVDADRWGEGLASELGGAAVDHAFTVLGLEEVVAYALPSNMTSRRVMEKLGFAHEDANIEHAGLDHVLYRLRARPPSGPEGELA